MLHAFKNLTGPIAFRSAVVAVALQFGPVANAYDRTAPQDALITPALGSAPSDWIARYGTPRGEKTLEGGLSRLEFDLGYVVLLAVSRKDVVVGIGFVPHNSRNDFEVNEEKLWALLQQYSFPRRTLTEPDHDGDFVMVHGGFVADYTPPGVGGYTHGSVSIHLANYFGSGAASDTPRTTPAPTESGSGQVEKVTRRLEVFDVELRRHDGDFAWVYGRIRNASSQAVRNVNACVTFLDAKNRVVNRRDTFANASNVISPGEDGDFSTFISDPDRLVTRVEVKASVDFQSFLDP